MKIRSILSIVVLFALLSSCLVEQKIVLKYQDQFHDTPILFTNSAEIYLVNSKGKIPNNISPEILTYNYDSSFQNSDLVKSIDVYDYKNDFGKYLLRELKSNNLNIYTADSIIPFIRQSKPRMIIDVIQIEVEEYYDTYYDEIDDLPITFKTANKYLHLKEADVESEYDSNGTENYYSSVSIPRNALIVNLWLQIDLWFYDSTHSSSTIFMDYVFADNIEGAFVMKGFKNPQYLYTIDSLQTHDLWKISEIPNKVFAENIIDFLINNIIENRVLLMSNRSPAYNYKYKKSSGLIIPNKEELPYIILHEEE